MSRKIITILTAVMLACSVLTACGSSQGDNSTSESTTTTAAATEKAENTTTTTAEAEESKPDTDSISEQEDREAAALSTLPEGVARKSIFKNHPRNHLRLHKTFKHKFGYGGFRIVLIFKVLD